MVHKKFVNPISTKEDTWIDRTPHRGARNYLDEMAPINGFHEENADALRMRDAFRDEVSKRMGELLLKGQTMLDEYCPTCSGILMEDRTGARRCVTCELYAEKLEEAGHIVAEIPLQEEDLKDAVDKTPPRTQPPVQKKAPVKTASAKPAAPAAAPKKKVVRVEQPAPEDELEALAAAKIIVIQKLEWATVMLSGSDDTTRVLDFLAVIQKSAETLKSLQI